MSETNQPTSGLVQRILNSIGPAIITASVVLGPGSILSSSKIGFLYGYQMIWVLAIAVALMIGMTALSARLGILLEGTLCDELARRANRPLAALTGISLFLIAACFQFSNNIGVVLAIEPFLEEGNKSIPIVVIVGVNILVVVALLGFKTLYANVERLMKLLVGVMTIGFVTNLIFAKPDLGQLVGGLIPSFPEGTGNNILPVWDDGKVSDNMFPAVAMIATTFSIGAAFYQSYLVQQKGWGREELKQGFIDSTLGILILGGITLMILVTAASVLHGNENVTQLTSAADVARQLQPLFGSLATWLFCLGIFAGAFSSFLVNAMIGGSILSDGLGLGGYMEQKWPKVFTILALGIGMGVAIWIEDSGQKPVNLIIFAQAMTVLGVPLLAAVMLWLATRSDMVGDRAIPKWMILSGWVGLALASFLALRTAVKLLLPIIHGNA